MCKNILYILTGLILLLAYRFSAAGLVEDIANVSDAQIIMAGKKSAEAIAQTAPAQIDRTTILLGGIFYSGTKTIIYKYESTIPLDPKKMYSYIKKSMCTDPIKTAFMKRGMRYRHDYLTPVGLQTTTIGLQDCN